MTLSSYNGRNELMVTKRTDTWSIVEADQPGDFRRQARAREEPGTTLEEGFTAKKNARDRAGERMRNDDHPFMLLCSTKGRVSDVRWHKKYETLTIKPTAETRQSYDGKWILMANGRHIADNDNRSSLRERAINVQEEYGFRYVKIYRSDGTVYWKRQHPRWRRQ